MQNEKNEKICKKFVDFGIPLYNKDVGENSGFAVGRTSLKV